VQSIVGVVKAVIINLVMNLSMVCLYQSFFSEMGYQLKVYFDRQLL